MTTAKAQPAGQRPALSRDEAYQSAIRAFGDVAGAIGEVRELDELLHLIARHVCELAGVHRCSVYLRDGDSELFRGQVGHSDSEIDARVKRLVAGVPGDDFTSEILRTKAPVILQDALHDPRPLKSTMRAWKIRSMMGVPMVARGDVIGARSSSTTRTAPTPSRPSTRTSPPRSPTSPRSPSTRPS